MKNLNCESPRASMGETVKLRRPHLLMRGLRQRILSRSGIVALLLCGIFGLSFVAISAQVPEPKEVLGFTPGDDRKLASWAQIVDYFKKLDATSDRVKFYEIGRSTMGRPFVYAVFSSPENIKNLEKYKEINKKLADPRKIGAGTLLPQSAERADKTAAELVKQGKTIVLKTFAVHPNEVGSALSSVLIAHRLASSNEADIKKILDETITIIVPALSPDGIDIIKDWYDKTLDTPYEGTLPPELYHKYVGHDLNRDWYAFTQVETQLTVEHIHNVWHPQIVHDTHQQGTHGARFFVPPYMDPVEPNVPKQIVEGYTELGLYVAGDMRKKGLQGLTTGTTYDAWTPARAYSHYHGGVRILSETASARLASPITVKAEQLRGGRGVDPHKDDANNGPAWKGGEWKMRDITNYMTTAAFSILDHAAANREKWLTRFYEIGKEAVRPRTGNELRGFVLVPRGKYDEEDQGEWYDENHGFGEIFAILARAQVNFKPITNSRYPHQSVFIPIDQPYGSFVKALFETQTYPTLRDTSGNPIAPYDVTAHTLPLLLDEDIRPVFGSFKFSDIPLKSGMNAGSTSLAFKDPNAKTTYVDREGPTIYRSYVPSMDEGWTRWVFEKTREFFGTNYENIDTAKIKTNQFTFPSSAGCTTFHNGSRECVQKYRAKTIVFPDQAPNQILNGYPKGSMPDEYVGGVGKEGVENLKKFVEAGGTLVFLNRSSLFAIEHFNLPIKNVTQGLNRRDFYIPGSILRTELDIEHPIAKGMPKESIAWFEQSPVFEVISTTPSAEAASTPPNQGGEPLKTESPDTGLKSPVSEIKVIAKYPEKAENILLSGWALGQDKIAGKAALVEVSYGKGKIVLFGFRPQYRGQSLATFPLLFNSISR